MSNDKLREALELGLDAANQVLADRKAALAGYPHKWRIEQDAVGKIAAALATHPVAAPEAVEEPIRWLVGLPGEPLSEHASWATKPDASDLRLMEIGSGCSGFFVTPLYTRPVAGVEAAPFIMVDMVPPATARDRWMYEQGRLAERDPRTPPAAPAEPLMPAFIKECAASDELLRILGLDATQCRTDGGAINLGRVRTFLSERAVGAPAEPDSPMTEFVVTELVSALNAMLTFFGMDEDESGKATFDKARQAMEYTRLATRPLAAWERQSLQDWRRVVRGWHEKAVANGYDGVESMCDEALPYGTRNLQLVATPAAPSMAGEKPAPLNSIQQFWVDNRSKILDAIRHEGFTLMSNQHGFFLARLGQATAAQEQKP